MPVLSGNACSHPTKLSVATLNLIKKKLEKNPTLTARQLKMRMAHSSVEEEEWSSQQAVCCHLGPHEEEAKENPTLTASQMKMRIRIEEPTTSLYTDMMNKLLFMKKCCFLIFLLLGLSFYSADCIFQS